MKRNDNQWQRVGANMLSLMSFYWLKPYIMVGQRRNLTENDIGQLPQEFKAEYLLNKFKSSSWNHIIDTDSSILSVVFSFINKWHYFLLTLLNTVTWCCYALNVIFLRAILQYLDGEKHITLTKAYIYCALFSVALFLRPMVEYVSRYILNERCAHIRTALTAMLYEKSLKVAINTYNTSHIVNLLSDDIQKFDKFLEWFPDCIGGAALIPSLFYLAYDMNNWCVVLGLIILLLFVGITSITTPKAAKIKSKILIFTDKRLKLIKEAVIGYLNTKMYSWELSIYNLVTTARMNEVNLLIKRGKIQAGNYTLMTMGDTLIICVVMLAYFYSESTLHLSGIYPVLMMYNYLIWYIVFAVPGTLQSYHELKISLKRIPHFLRTTELKNLNNINDDMSPSIHIKNLSFLWPCAYDDETQKNNSKQQIKDKSMSSVSNSPKIALSSINLSIDQKGLYGIIGKVGSGKTALLLSLIGELKSFYAADLSKDDTEFAVCGKIGYCSQVPWIFNASVKENILFGNVYDKEWYDKVIYVCCLDKDLMQLPHCDETIIGERGLNLSGGQKSRVNLARCIYDKPDILLLDDILSSVDSIVGKHLFANILSNKSELMKNKLVVVVTHQMNILPFMKKIFVMEKGEIACSGDYQQVSQGISKSISISKPNLLYKHEKDEQKYDTEIAETDTEMASKEIQNYKSKNNSILAQKQSVVQTEESKVGAVPFSVYLSILFPNSSKCIQMIKLTLLTGLLFSAQIFQTASQYFLGIWASFNSEEQSNPKYVIIYVSLVVVGIILDFVRFVVLFKVIFRGSFSLHNKMFSGVLHSSMRFFEANPVGRILNRFSQDQMNVDDRLPLTVANTVWVFCRFTMVFILAGMTSPFLYIILVPVTLMAIWSMKLYMSVSRSLRRLEATTKSPIYAYFTICSAGLSTIRSYKKQNFVLENAFKIIERNISVSLIYLACQKWIAFTLDMFMSLCTVLTIFSCICIANTGAMSKFENSKVGVTLLYFLWVCSTLSWGIRCFADTENFMTSTERIVEYSHLKSEQDELNEYERDRNANRLIIEPSNIANWPKTGNIKFVDLSVSYRDCFDPVLKNVSFEINHGEKIGVVGRTGSGKSTLFKSIYRFLKFDSGHIEIDGVNICNVPLLHLRKCLFIIPQNCILFSSTLRYNLDPFSECDDEELYKTLQDVQLNVVKSNDNNIDSLENALSLDTMMTEHGTVSVGESQLICIARAILNYKKNKILLIDEATANIDKHTEDIIQNLFQTNLFKNKTVLTIAHRINTVINYDKVLVLEKGQIVEFDSPQNLLQNDKSLFCKMYRQHH
eukprot:153284_1